MPALLALGVWQLQRADEKQQLLDAMAESPLHYQLPVAPRPLPARYELSGKLLADRYFLLDNRTRSGRAGYDVIGVLAVDGSSTHLLVNLGWLLAPASRTELPKVEMPEGPLTIQGWLVESMAGFRLDEPPSEAPVVWPHRVQQADWQTLQQSLGVALYPALLRVDQSYLVGADTQWQAVAMPPEKHYGYAVQWFALALMAVIWLWWWQRGNGGHE